MSSLVISNFKTGFENNLDPFLINNDAFPLLNNFYCWRGKVRRKRGTKLLGRLQRDLTSIPIGVTDGAGTYTGNLITSVSLNLLSNIVQGSITVTVGAQVFTETMPAGQLTNGTLPSNGTINYNSGDITIVTNPPLAATDVVITFSYYPTLPVMGLEDFKTDIENLPRLVALDTIYAYEYDEDTSKFFDVSFYKLTHTPITWSGTDFQQFWSTNYSGAMWVTNGQPGFSFKAITMITQETQAKVTIDGHGLKVGSIVYFNEVRGMVEINDRFGTIPPLGIIDDNNFRVDIDSTGFTAYVSNGIAQYLTDTAPGTNVNGIRWYDGNPIVSPSKGWVNFAPPTSQFNENDNPSPEYIVGAKIIVAFKNRLLFFAPYTQRSLGGPEFRPNQVMWSQDGTPYYTDPVPDGQASQPEAWYQNIVGRGGRLGAPIQDEIVTVDENEDVLLVGFFGRPLKFYFTSDDSNPFLYQTINTELGSESTFASVSLDTGALTIGQYGFAMITQNSAQRIDAQIPDEVFNISLEQNSTERITGIRDYRNEFVYFTYPYYDNALYPTRTLLYNYKDATWATFDEIYTTYGRYTRNKGYTWANIGTIYPTWADWNDPWSFGGDRARFPSIVGGNQHGFVLRKDDGTTEAQAHYISNLIAKTVTATNHSLSSGDYIYITGLLADNPAPDTINNKLYQITIIDRDSFFIDGNIDYAVEYIGGGTYKRIPVPKLQSKQFANFWGNACKTIIGTQRYLFTPTYSGEVTAQVYTSQDDSNANNDPLLSDYLPFTDVVLTFPEPGYAYTIEQDQIWHRVSNTFLGDTVQFGITLSDVQMRDLSINEMEITLHAVVINLEQGPMLV